MGSVGTSPTHKGHGFASHRPRPSISASNQQPLSGIVQIVRQPSRLQRCGRFVRHDGAVLDASSFAGQYGSYGWLLAVLVGAAVLSVLRRLVRLALLLVLVTLAVLVWRSGAVTG